MDAISYSYADKAHKRIKKIINDPDSTSGVVTVPSVIAAGETITIPAGRTAVLPDVQIDGTLNVQGTVFIPTGTKTSKVIPRVTSTDNAIVRFDGTTGDVQNSTVIVDDNGNVGIGTGSNINAKLDVAGSIRQYNPGASDNSVINYINGSKNWYAGLRGDSANVWSVADETSQKLMIDSTGNVLVTGSGGLGYGTGSGGTVTQPPTNGKATAVTLNKPSGQITMNNAALAAGGYVGFIINNSILSSTDGIIITQNDKGLYVGANYDIKVVYSRNGVFLVIVKNVSPGTLSDAVSFRFDIIKGAIA